MRISSARALLGVVLLIGCFASFAGRCGKSGGSSGAGITPGSGVYIASSSALKPDANPGPQQIMYAGTIIPAESKTNLSGDDFSIDLIYNGVSMEKEIYKSTATEFALVDAAGETYNSPIPLLKFPMNAGASWSWSGEMMTGPTGRKATANIKTREDKISFAGITTDALVVEVELSMESGANAPARRKLEFWFVKDKGLVKREFGASTSREPAPATEAGMAETTP